jgi:hypothetical protein
MLEYLFIQKSQYLNSFKYVFVIGKYFIFKAIKTWSRARNHQPVQFLN